MTVASPAAGHGPTTATTWRDDLSSAAATMTAILVAFGAVYGLGRVVDVPPQQLVLAVVLTLTLSRTLSRSHFPYWLVLVEVPVLGSAATAAGWLVLHEPWIGQPLLVLALCGSVLARRWGGLRRQAGTIVALPFLALLVTPLPRVERTDAASLTGSSLLWGAAVGLVAVTCATVAQRVRARFVPAAGSLSRGPSRGRRRGLDAASRGALQLVLALSAALGLGHLLFGEHWPWAVLSAYIVMSGARGRGDVAHKAGLRIIGAGLGTVAATSVTAYGLPAGNRWLVVAVFVVMAVALVLRNRNYAYWAAGVTGMIALVDGYYGTTTSNALPDRVLGVLLGSGLGVAAAWFVLPVRTRDVLRRYLADALAALTVDLDPESAGPQRTPVALGILQELTPTLRAHRRSIGRRHELHPLDAVAALHRLAVLPVDERDRRRLRRDVVRVRRAILGRSDRPPHGLPPDLAVVHQVIQSTLSGRSPLRGQTPFHQ